MAEIVAIDLGTTKLVAVAGTRNENGYFHVKSLHSVPSEGIKYGEVQNIGSVVAKTKILVEKLKVDISLDKIEDIYVGIAGQNIRFVSNSYGKLRPDCDVEISETELKELETEIKNKMALEPGDIVLDVVPQKYTIDGEDGILKPDAIGRLGHELKGHFHVLIGKESSRKHTVMCMSKLNLPAKAIILEPIASSRAVLNKEEKQVGVVMIDMGGGTTDLIVYKNNVMMHTAVIPFGCNVITSDIETCFCLSRERAEEIKIQYGTCNMSKYKTENEYFTTPRIQGRPPVAISYYALAGVIHARVEELINMVLHEIAPFLSILRLGAGIVFTGGGAHIDGIKELLTVKSGMHVKIGKPNYISSESKKGADNCIYSTAIGLLMCGADDAEGKIHFIDVSEDNAHKKQKTYAPPTKKKKIMDTFKYFFTEKEEEV